MGKKPKRPRDPNQLGKLIVDIATGERDDTDNMSTDSGKNPHAVALSKLGSSKGGVARAEKLTPKQRQDIARKAAQTRWKSKKK